MKLLVVEDDKTVGQYVKRGLEEQQYIADWVHGWRRGLAGRVDRAVRPA